MAIAPITVKDRVKVVCVSDPDVSLPEGRVPYPIFLYQAHAVVQESEAIVEKGATVFEVRGLRDTELAGVSGKGEHTAFIGCYRLGIVKIKPKMDVESVPYAVKCSIGQFVLSMSQGYMIECISDLDKKALDDLADEEPKGEDTSAPLERS